MKLNKIFEIYILRPLDILSYVLIVIFLIKTSWFWLTVSIISALYLGFIGQGLHPLQSAFDLAKGPTSNISSKSEDLLLPDMFKKRLVSRACTKVGILIGVVIGLILFKNLGWHWYFVLPIIFISIIFSAGLLKYLFKTI